MSYIPGLSPFAANRARPYYHLSTTRLSLVALRAIFFSSLFSFLSPPPAIYPPREIATERSRVSGNQKSPLSKIQKKKNSFKNSRRRVVFLLLVEFLGIIESNAFETRCTAFRRLLFFRFSPSLSSQALARPPKLFRVFNARATRPRDTVQQFSKPVRRMKIVDGRHSTGE